PMSALASSLFAFGVTFVALGFAAHVGHAVMLANGRRLVSVRALAVAPQPAFAGVVTGSFVSARERSTTGEIDVAASPSPLSKAAIALTLAGWIALGASVALRAYLVGRGPWGNMFEFSVAFSFSMIGGYLFLQ